MSISLKLVVSGYKNMKQITNETFGIKYTFIYSRGNLPLFVLAVLNNICSSKPKKNVQFFSLTTVMPIYLLPILWIFTFKHI